MIKIDLKNDVVEFSHIEAMQAACFLLSYINKQGGFNGLKPKKFLASFEFYYKEFLKNKKPYAKYQDYFSLVKKEHSKALDRLEKLALDSDKKEEYLRLHEEVFGAKHRDETQESEIIR